MADVPFCSEVGKTAFPVRAVIEWFNITDSHQRDLVYQFADLLAREMREPGSTPTPREGDKQHPLARALLDAFGLDLCNALSYHLQQNLKRSMYFQQDIARVESNLLRSLLTADYMVRKVKLMTYIQRAWSHDLAYLVLIP